MTATSTILKTLLTTPLLTLISIPLILSASITTAASIFALSLRISIIYTEFCYAIAANYFVIPTSDYSSLLSFEPGTPRPGSRSVSRSRSKSRIFSSSSSSSSGFDDSHQYGLAMSRLSSASSSKTRATTAAAPLRSFVSDDERRDFEGVGGWGPTAGTGTGIIRASTSTSTSPPPPVWRRTLATSTPNCSRRRHHRRSLTAPMLRIQDPSRRSDSALFALRLNRPEPGGFIPLGSGKSGNLVMEKGR